MIQIISVRSKDRKAIKACKKYRPQRINDMHIEIASYDAEFHGSFHTEEVLLFPLPSSPVSQFNTNKGGMDGCHSYISRYSKQYAHNGMLFVAELSTVIANGNCSCSSWVSVAASGMFTPLTRYLSGFFSWTVISTSSLPQ